MGYGIVSPATAQASGRDSVGIFSPAHQTNSPRGRDSVGIFRPASSKDRDDGRPSIFGGGTARARPSRPAKGRHTSITVNRDGSFTIRRSTGGR